MGAHPTFEVMEDKVHQMSLAGFKTLFRDFKVGKNPTELTKRYNDVARLTRKNSLDSEDFLKAVFLVVGSWPRVRQVFFLDNYQML